MKKVINEIKSIKTYLSNLTEKDPMIRVLPPGEELSEGLGVYDFETITETKWSFPGKEGMKTTIIIISGENEVELFVNGESYGRKKVGVETKYYAIYETLYQPGIIEAISYHKNFEYGRAILQ